MLFGHPSAWVATIACVVLYDVAGDATEIAYLVRRSIFNLALLAGLLAHLLPRETAVGTATAEGRTR